MWSPGSGPGPGIGPGLARRFAHILAHSLVLSLVRGSAPPPRPLTLLVLLVCLGTRGAALPPIVNIGEYYSLSREVAPISRSSAHPFNIK